MEKPQKTKEKEEFPKGVILDKYGNPYGEDNAPVTAREHKKFEPIPTVKTEKKIEKESPVDSSKLKALKEVIHNLNERYLSEPQREQKAILHNQLEEAKKEYGKLEEELDTRPQMSEQDKKFAKLKALKEVIHNLNERYLSEPQREQKAILYSQLEKAKKEYQKLEEELDGASAEGKKKPDPNQNEKKEGEIDNTPPLNEEKKGSDLDQNEKVEKEIGNTSLSGPESDLPLDELNDLRDDYLKAKRLRGNVFRGKIMGGLFGRKLPNFSSQNFEGEDMYFGGKKGAQELEKVRKEYEEGLSQYRSKELAKLEKDLAEKIEKGTITPEEANTQIQTKIIGLLSEEQTNIDTRSVQGIERNMLEKMKTKWRQSWGKRLIAGGGLYGASAVLAATGVGGVVAAGTVLGARAAMGGVGVYVSTEAALERYGKTLGHVGLINEINKTKFTTDESLYKHICALSPEDVKKEAARLRMLQVEKGLSIGGMDNKKKIATMIINRDNELTAQEVMKSANSENPTSNFADILSNKLATEINSRNEIVESEVDKERRKKMARKILATTAGVGVGWLIGGSLFSDTATSADAAASAHAPTSPDGPLDTPIPPIDHIIDHTLVHGDKLWNILATNPDVQHVTAGLSKGAHTFFIDVLKDKFANMTPSELIERGFNTHGLTDSAEIINHLDVGNVLHLHGIVDNTSLLAETLKNAQDLSPAATAAIEHHDTLLATWTAAHPHQALTNAIIEKIIKGK